MQTWDEIKINIIKSRIKKQGLKEAAKSLDIDIKTVKKYKGDCEI